MGSPYAEVIGDPIAHSKSPLIHKFWLEKLGIPGDYRATRVAPADLADYFSARRADPDWRGCNVTMPLKQSVTPWLDEIDASADWAGSVNCVFWDGEALSGCNTDSSGLGAAIEAAEVENNPVAIIGSGAAAGTALSCAVNEPAGEVRLVARDVEKGRKVLERLGTLSRCFEFSRASEAFSGATLVVNATPLGMTGFPPMPANVLEALRHTRVDAVVQEMVYSPLETELLTIARTFGRRTFDGLAMLIGQAQDSFSHFFPATAPVGAWKDPVLRELLTR